MSAREAVLLYAFGDEHDALAGRLVLLGYRPLRASEPGVAKELIARQEGAVRAMLMPVDAPFDDRRAALEELTSTTRSVGLQVVACGKPPAPEELDALRGDGVRFCLWAPNHDGELRFVVNRALYDRTRGEVRLDTRVPTDLMARVKGGGGEKPALVYNLSRGGAFLETHRPSMQGATVAVTFPFPGSPLTIQSKVVSANVPGNLQRHNLPRGMGVEFADPTSEQIAAIDEYVVARVRSFEI
jgi:hypothetical protein